MPVDNLFDRAVTLGDNIQDVGTSLYMVKNEIWGHP